MHCSLVLFVLLAFADDGSIADTLKAKGVQVRQDKSGAVTEVSAAYKTTLALDDYKKIGEFRSVRRIWLSPMGQPLDDQSLAALGPMESVENFFANGAKLTDDGMKGFAGWKNLKHLGFDHWGWFETPDKKMVGRGLAHLAKLPNLESIRLGGCRIDNAAATALAEIKTLRKLDLGHTSAIDDAGIPALAGLPKLTTIILSPQYSPRITDASLEHLSKMPSLEEIDIAETLLTYNAGLSHLAKLPNLKLLKLTNVVAAKADVDRFRNERPQVTVTWTEPTEETATKTRQSFERAKSKSKSKSK
jgi:Leucine Rich repeat